MIYILKLKNNKFFFKILLFFVVFVSLFLVGSVAKGQVYIEDMNCCLEKSVKGNNDGICLATDEKDSCWDYKCALKWQGALMETEAYKKLSPIDKKNSLKLCNLEFQVKIRRVKCDYNTQCEDMVKAKIAQQGGYIPPCEKEKTISACQNKLCFWSTTLNECLSKISSAKCSYLTSYDCGQIADSICRWEPDKENPLLGKCIGSIQQNIQDNYLSGRTDNKSKILPNCAIVGSCNEINDIMEVLIKGAKEIFKYIGALAFIFFVFGGFTMILSFGNAEKFKKGKSILVAAVVGLLISFSAYFIIDFVLTALNVSSTFTL